MLYKSQQIKLKPVNSSAVGQGCAQDTFYTIIKNDSIGS
jgi:hypothetical protein